MSIAGPMIGDGSVFRKLLFFLEALVPLHSLFINSSGGVFILAPRGEKRSKVGKTGEMACSEFLRRDAPFRVESLPFLLPIPRLLARFSCGKRLVGIVMAACLAVSAIVIPFAGALQARELTVKEIEKRKAWDAEREKKREERMKRKKKTAKDKPPAMRISIAFINKELAALPALSNLDPILTDEGIYGARLAIEDNNTTGSFLNHEYVLDEVTVPLKGDLVAAFKELVGGGHRHIVVNLAAEDILTLADLPEAEGVMIYNTSAPDDSLREEQCRGNVLHLIPSRSMKADALAQYLVKKNWKRWFLVIGPRREDELFAAALRRAGKRFGGKIVEEKVWNLGPDLRRTASAELPVFTQGVDYDVLLVADEIGEFGEYLVWHTWDPRLVAGTQGLVPTAWHRTHERWGAAQMQNRFRREVGRWMTSIDYAAWVAVRSVGESVTQVNSTDFDKIVSYMLSPEFSLAAYKGIKVTYRPWNGQLRQRILLAVPRSMVSVSPQKEFLHQVSEVDTLGYDEPETKCKLER